MSGWVILAKDTECSFRARYADTPEGEYYCRHPRHKLKRFSLLSKKGKPLPCSEEVCPRNARDEVHDDEDTMQREPYNGDDEEEES